MEHGELDWRVKGQEELCSTPHLRVVREIFESAVDGSEFPWLTVQRKSAVVLLAETASGKFVMIRQFRPSVRRVIWEFPAGQIDGEATKSVITETARRELREETGYELIGNLEPMGHFFSSPGFTNEEQLVFRLRAKKGRRLPGDDVHRICAVEEIEPTRLTQMIMNGEILDSKTLAICTLLLYNVKSRGEGNF